MGATLLLVGARHLRSFAQQDSGRRPPIERHPDSYCLCRRHRSYGPVVLWL